MDEFGSPISGGIRAVRRNISSSFFGAPRQPQADPITTDLLQQQSLQLTSVSSQLQKVSQQISGLNFNLKTVKENLALNEQLEKQREAARQNRERILAEQGLREGKESELEKKIQSSLTKPIERLGVKTQGILNRLTTFLFTLAGGWLTLTGIDLLQALTEGNVDKINKLKTKFLVGLGVIVGSFTAISIGIKKVIGILGVFAGNVARVAFGGILKASLRGVQLLLGGLVRKAATIPFGLFGGGGFTQFVRSIVENIIALKLLGAGGAGKQNAAKAAASTFFNNTKKKASRTKTSVSTGSNSFSRTMKNVQKEFQKNVGRVTNPIRKKLFPTTADIVASGGVFRKGSQSAMLSPMKVARESGLNPLKNTIKNLFKKLPGKNMLLKLLGAVGIKGGLSGLLKKFGGPFGSFVIRLAMGEGLGSALLGAAGFAAGAAIGQVLIPIPVLGAFIGGILGESLLRKMFGFAKNLLGLNKNKDKDGEVSNKLPNLSEDDFKPIGVTEEKSINPVKNNKLEVAENISNFDEDVSQVINLNTNTGNNQSSEGAAVNSSKESIVLPNILFDNNNPHVMYATALTGVNG